MQFYSYIAVTITNRIVQFSSNYKLIVNNRGTGVMAFLTTQGVR